MKTLYCIFILLFTFTNGICQKKLDKLLKRYNDESIPYIYVEDLQKKVDEVILLDARETIEYQVSHIKNAIHVGYDHFSLDQVIKKKLPKDSPIVVYCSLGIRSEDISEKLNAAGYTNIQNLYGGIFEWKNKNYKIVNLKNTPTDSIHAFSKEWGKWATKGIKVY